MKKILLIFLACLSISLNGQIQITQSNMPSINDTIRYTQSTGGSLDFEQTGANYHWDYSGLSFVSQDIYKFQALTSTPYSTLLLSGMPFGAIGYKVADSLGAGQFAFKNLYNFFEKKSSGWRAVGTGFTLSVLPIPAGGLYSDPDEIYTFPLNYNDKDSTTFSVTTPLGNQFIQLGTLKQKGYRLNTVEGWGTITTPYGSNINCLKIKSVIVEIDSLKVSTPPLNIGFPTTRVEYKWLSTTEKIPILEVVGTEASGNFTPTQIRYRDNFRNPSNPVNIIRVRFNVDKIIGIKGVDSFNFTNTSTPAFGSNYIWRFNPSLGIRYVNNTDSTSAEPSVVFDSTGVYNVTLLVSNLLGNNDSTAFNMIQINANNQQSIAKFDQEGIHIFPNPVQGNIHLNTDILDNSLYQFYDLSGKLVSEGLISNEHSIPCEQLAAGTYILLVRNLETILFTQIIKE
ncbi:MAG: T9SS type A sorting domain-containing protein [Bacteroidia bacterium]|nr:T9SS type A sorting domain-containing protein [Bacteroidia bacterium]